MNQYARRSDGMVGSIWWGTSSAALYPSAVNAFSSGVDAILASVKVSPSCCSFIIDINIDYLISLAHVNDNNGNIKDVVTALVQEYTIYLSYPGYTTIAKPNPLLLFCPCSPPFGT
jgi:hypothetical protein